MNALAAKLRRRLSPDRRNNDDGTALILALLVILVVGTLLAAVLDFTRTGLTIVPGERDDRNTSNYIQGAVQGAINSIRGSSELGREDVAGCPDFTPPVPSGVSGVTGSTFKVTCSGVATGDSGGDDRPRFAIHALGVAPEGIRQVAGNDLLYVNGGVYSRGVVGVTGGGSANAMRINGTLTARGGCSGAVTTTDLLGKNCSAGASAFDTAPDYHPALGDDAALQALINAGTLSDGADPVPSCTSGRAVFQPGYYQETPPVLAAKLVSCSGASVYEFRPGTYYFDYPGVWDLNSTKIFAGTYTGTNTFTTGCSHSDAAPAPGAQFILGGGSQIFTKSSSGSTTEGMEICGPEKGTTINGKPQRIAFYVLSGRDSLTSPVPASTTSTYKYAAGPTTPAASGNVVAFTLPGNAQQIDTVLQATGVLGKDQSASLDYAPLVSTPPKGSDVTKAVIKVAHTLGPNTNATLHLTWPGSATSTDIDVTNSNCPSGLCDITSALTAKDIAWRALAQMSVSYEIAATGNSIVARTTLVDGIELQVTYRPPGLRATTCTGSCVVLESQQNPNVFFHGTVYAPASAMAVRIHNSGETIFDRGVIVRDIAIDMNSSSKQTSSPFSVPSGTPTGRLVLFRGYVNGVEKVRACARYVDQATNPDGSVSAYSGYSMTIPKWLVMRTPSTATPGCT